MRFIGKTIQFLRQNFFYLLFFNAVPPPPLAAATVMPADAESNVLGWSLTALILDAFRGQTFEGGMFESLTLIFKPLSWFRVLSLFVLVLALALTLSYCDRKMRVGISSLQKPFLKLNETILISLLFLFLLVAVYELVAFVFCSMADLALAQIADGVWRGIAALLCVLLVMIVYSLWPTLLVTFPANNLILGYSVKEAFSVSVKSAQGHFFRIWFGLVFPVLICLPLLTLSGLLPDYLFFFRLFVYIVCYLFFITYWECFFMVSYFEISGRERADLKRIIPYGL